MNFPWTSRRKNIGEITASWGKFRERSRDFKALAAHFAGASGDTPDPRALDQRTWDDLNMDDVFAVLDRTESALGQRALYARLRQPSSENHLDAFEALVTRFSNDGATRERAQLALGSLGDVTHGRPLAAAARELRIVHGDNTAALTAPLAEGRRAEPSRLAAAIGEVDAALSVASYRAGTSGWVRPAFLKHGEQGVMAEVRHPLLPEAVANTFELGPPHGVIITGSNMSGKSTFLRTVGVTAVLAQTINTCVAEKYACPRFVVRSCIGRADDPASGRSYYVMEVDAVLALVHAARTNAVHLMLFDELFRGTNAIERIAAGEAVLAALVPFTGARHVVVAATHDDELVDLLAGRYEPYYFTDRVDGAGIFFDYKIRPGSATTRNAIALLKMRGAPAELVEYASIRATRLERARQEAADAAAEAD
jgi:DNA mismatch repair ATPase MutS